MLVEALSQRPRRLVCAVPACAGEGSAARPLGDRHLG